MATVVDGNHSGLQLKTVRNIALAWILTLPVTMLLAGALFAGTARSAIREAGQRPILQPRPERVLRKVE